MTEQNTLQNELDRIVLKTAVDADFRQAFIADPHAAYAAEGVEVPESVSIDIIESSETNMAVALPPFVGDKLSVDELEVVAGGSFSDVANLVWGKVKEHGPGIIKQGVHLASGAIHNATK